MDVNNDLNHPKVLAQQKNQVEQSTNGLKVHIFEFELSLKINYRVSLFTYYLVLREIDTKYHGIQSTSVARLTRIELCNR